MTPSTLLITISSVIGTKKILNKEVLNEWKEEGSTQEDWKEN